MSHEKETTEIADARLSTRTKTRSHATTRLLLLLHLRQFPPTATLSFGTVMSFCMAMILIGAVTMAR